MQERAAYLAQPIAPEPVTAALDRSVAAFPDRPAIDFLNRKYTYGELGKLVDRAMVGLQKRGVGKGTKVGLCLPNCPYYVIAYHAILKAGATVVNFNPLYTEREIAGQIKDSGTTIMVTLDLKQIYPKVAAQFGGTPLERIVVCSMAASLPATTSLLFRAFKRSEIARPPRDDRHIAFQDLLSDGAPAKPVEIDPLTDVAVLQYTGGTTGTPKGAMLTHANLSANAEQLTRWIPDAVPGRESLLGVLPFFHVFGMSVVQNTGIRMAAELILLPRFELQQVLKWVVKKRPSLFPGVPTIYTAINQAVAKKPMDLTSIRYCISGGAPLPVEVRDRFQELTGCRLVEGYGLTESAPVACCNPFDGAVKGGSVGLPMPRTEVEIRDRTDLRRVMPQGEKGEVCIKGPQVMAGYFNRPTETENTFVDGWLRTGDIGYKDTDGYIFLVDRIKDVILAGGYNVYPRVIEEVLYQHPAIAEAVVIGIPDDYRGEAPKAFVVLKDGASATTEDLRSFIGEHLSKIECPKLIEIRDSLPKTMVGKLSKKELVEEERAKAAKAQASPSPAGPPAPRLSA